MRIVVTTYKTINTHSVLRKALLVVDRYNFLDVKIYEEKKKDFKYTNGGFYGNSPEETIYELVVSIEGEPKTTADLIGELENL